MSNALRLNEKVPYLSRFFKSVVKSKPLFTIWTSRSLMMRMNKLMPSRKRLNSHQFGWFLRLQIEYVLFKNNNKGKISYIFIPRKKPRKNGNI